MNQPVKIQIKLKEMIALNNIVIIYLIPQLFLIAFFVSLFGIYSEAFDNHYNLKLKLITSTKRTSRSPKKKGPIRHIFTISRTVMFKQLQSSYVIVITKSSSAH